jgi:hypothetical protein
MPKNQEFAARRQPLTVLLDGQLVPLSPLVEAMISHLIENADALAQYEKGHVSLDFSTDHDQLVFEFSPSIRKVKKFTQRTLYDETGPES